MNTNLAKMPSPAGAHWYRLAGVRFPALPDRSRRIIDYAVAIVLPTATVALSLVLQGPQRKVPFYLLYMLSAMLSALVGGLRPGLLSTALSAVYSLLLFGTPAPLLAPVLVNPRTAWSAFALSLVISLVSVVLIASVREKNVALRKSEERYRTLFESIDEGFCIVEVLFDENGTPCDFQYLEINPAFHKHAATSLENVGKKASEVLPNLEASWFEILGKVVSTGEPAAYVQHYGAADSWFEGHAFRVGKPEEHRVAMMFSNVSERKRTEDQLRESEDRYRDLVEHSQDLICTHDLSGRLLSVNPTPAKILGYSVAELLAIPMREIVVPEFREQFDLYLERIKRQGEDRGYLTVMTRTGERRIWEYENTLRTEGVEFPVVRGMARDVTAKVRAEAALKESERQFRTLADFVPQMVWMCTPDGLNIYFNQRWVDYTGMPLEESYGRGWNKPFHDDDKRKAWNAWNRAVATGDRYQVEARLRAADGSYRWFLMQGAPLLDASGAVVKWFGTCTDIEDIKRAEGAVRDSEQRVAGIIGAAMDAIITVDEEQRIVLFNTAAEKMFRCREVEVLGQKVERFIPQRLRAGHSVHIQKFGKDGVTKRAMGTLDALWAMRADGEEFPIEASISKIEPGGKKLFTVIMRDITARRQAEKSLREYARVVEGLEEMIVVVDQEYRYLIANRAFLTFRGMSAEQVVGHTVEEVVGKEPFETRVKAKMDECFQGRVVRYEMLYDLPGLGKRDLWVSYFPIEGQAGVDRIACVLQDITERKLAEEALHKSEDRFSKAFRNNPLAISLSTQAEGRFLDVNEAFLKMLGYSRQAVIGHTVRDLCFWDDPSDRVEMLRQLKEKDRVAKHHTRFKTAKGELREAEIWAESIELDGQPCVLAITHDITDMQQLEAQFRQAQKMEAVGRLAGGVAHDFNNILGIIMGYSDISLDKIPADNPAKRYLSETKKAAQRGALLTQQLLAFSRKQVVFPKILDLNEVVRNANKMFLRLVGEDITVEFRPKTPLGLMRADSSQIEQVLMNLVVNARDAMPTGGKIIIETGHAEMDEHYVSRHEGAHAGQQVLLTVSDTGCGMDETTRSRIFEPFYTTKELGKGTGLGLSTVYGIVKQSDGYIAVYSEPGKGTTFKIYFPLIREKGAEVVAAAEEAAPPQGSETVLVVEDDKNLREVAVTLLQQGGYHVMEARDAVEALRIMKESPEIDLLLTDVIMPDKSGADLAREATASQPKLRCLYMSGYTDDLVSRQGVRIDEASFLEKPFTKKSLLTKVYTILHGNPPPRGGSS